MQSLSFRKKNNNNSTYKNPLEAIRGVGQDTVKKTFDAFSSIGGSMVDQIFGGGGYTEKKHDDEDELLNNESLKKKLEKTPKQNQIFNYTEYYETTLIKRQIKELTEVIKKEIEALKKAGESFINEVKDIEKNTINALPEKPGIYHVRFLEIVLNILRVLRAKVGESKTWLQALISKKKKRGSLFVVRSKKAGTQYSLSQELQTARSVQ